MQRSAPQFTRRNVVDVLSHPRWLLGVLSRYVVTTGMPRYQNFPPHMQTRITALPMGRSSAMNDTLTWDDVRQLRKLWPRKLIIKGIQHPRDAVLAADCGAAAVMLGRAPLHGIASAGEAGALRALQIYRDEIDRVMALIGCPSVADLSPSYVVMPPAD